MPAMLAAFRGRRASVVLWNVQTDHRVLSVHSGAYERMRLEARARVRETGLVLDHVLSDISPVSPRVSAGSRQDIMLASAPLAEVVAAITPLTEAGIRVRAVLTPAAALQSLARLRKGGVDENAGIEAWIGLQETSACIAVLRAGQLIHAQDVAWGFLDELSDFQSQRDRYDVAVRLADEVGALQARQHFDEPLTQVFICGAMPELRSMSVQMMDRLDIEVEPLDSFFGIDERRLPDSEDAFHDAVSGLRLAWAAAGNSHPALDLYRAPRRRVTRMYLSRAAVFAGAAAGLGVGWAIAHALPPVAATPGAEIAAMSVPRSPAAIESARPELQPALSDRDAAPPLLARRTITAPAGMLIAAMTPEPLSITTEQHEEAPVAVEAAARRPWEAVPPLSASVRLAVANPPARQVPPREIQPIATSPEPPPARAQKTSKVASATEKPAAPEPALPFDATLETILFGRDRSLAIVNGRIVQVGDAVNGAHIEEITPGAVTLRDSQGRLRRLSLGTR